MRLTDDILRRVELGLPPLTADAWVWVISGQLVQSYLVTALEGRRSHPTLQQIIIYQPEDAVTGDV